MTDPVFVVLEGIDGCGKSVQSRRLAEELGAVRYSFPDYKTPIGGLIKGHLKGQWYAQSLYQCDEALMFQALQSANRLEHAHDISMRLSAGQPVVADRYYSSGLVYGTADGIDLAYLERLHLYLPQPTHWILIDIDVEQSLERRPERRDRYESNAELMQKVCLLYRQLWIRKRWHIVDGRGSVEDTAGQIREIVC